jgi:hypothetical protein
MENFSFSALLGDARTLLFSLGVLAGSALIGVIVYLTLFALFTRLLRNSTSKLRLMKLKQMRSQARYLLLLLALVFALPTTLLPEHFTAPFEHCLSSTSRSRTGRGPLPDSLQWFLSM